MIYDTIERAVELLEEYFTSDMDAIITAKDEVGLSPEVTVYPRRDATVFGTGALPGLGVYVETATTRAWIMNQRRENRVMLTFDYFANGPDPNQLSKQVELAVEAIMRSIDRLNDGTREVLGGGEELHSVTIDLARSSHTEGMRDFQDRAIVRVPVHEEDHIS